MAAKKKKKKKGTAKTGYRNWFEETVRSRAHTRAPSLESVNRLLTRRKGESTEHLYERQLAAWAKAAKSGKGARDGVITIEAPKSLKSKSKSKRKKTVKKSSAKKRSAAKKRGGGKRKRQGFTLNSPNAGITFTQE